MQANEPADSQTQPIATRDVHSLANPEQIRVQHVALDLTVDFIKKQLIGSATLTVDRTSRDAAQPLILDTRNLAVESAEVAAGDDKFSATKFRMGATDAILGTPLIVELPGDAKQVRIHYRTSPMATALQWLEKSQTADKSHPFLFTQSQAINARSWIPLQDSPGVRVTYSAVIHCPKDLLAVMSAAGNSEKLLAGEYRFDMPHAIPPYLIALAVGDLQFKSLGPRTGIYAEHSVLPAAAAEFSDMEAMVKATEELYGEYRWGRYDVLVLPPSFPFGGMENPCLTFATPTILAGDKSLVSLVAHELAHSWSGNLVTNATWSDFWLNEGFTVFIERRIIEKLYGRARAESEAVLGRRELDDELRKLDAKARILHIDLKGQDPDDGVTNVPYEKGFLFLRHIETLVGRERFDRFLKDYFARFAFQSITTADFLQFLKANLLNDNAEVAAKLPLDEWIRGSETPASAPQVTSETFAKVETDAKSWLAGKKKLADIDHATWSPREWLHFLSTLPPKLDRAQLDDLDAQFGFTKSGNSEIACQWLLIAIRNGYAPADRRVEDFLISIGRRKFVKPLFEELVKSPGGGEKAMAIYRKARPGYHPITQQTIDAIVGWKPGK